MYKRSYIAMAFLLAMITLLFSGCQSAPHEISPDPKTYYVEPTATAVVIDSEKWLKEAEEMRTIANNVTAFRVGDKWGIVTSDGTVTYEPYFIKVYICLCNQGLFNHKIGRSTIVAVPPDSNGDTWIISDETGEMTCFHQNHAEVGRKDDDAYTSVIVGFQKNGLWGFQYEDGSEILVQPQYLQVTNPLLWNHDTYAWGQKESGWECVVIH